MKTFLRATALMLSLVFVMTGFAVPFAALRASAAGTGEGLGASAACEGHTLGTFSGLPACVNENGELHICENNFPDVNFRRFLTAKGSDGYFNEYYPTTLHVKSRGIKSLRGIEFFTRLTYLDCSFNQLTELNVTGFPILRYLYCDNNQLTELDVSNSSVRDLFCCSNQLTDLDVRNNTTLTPLGCYTNQLTELNVTGCTALTSLSCGSNRLTELDVTSCTALQGLFCEPNQRDLELISKNGLWTADIGELVSPSNFDRITVFSQGTFDSETGLLTFDSKPSSFTYMYDVGYAKEYRTMIVTVNLTDHVHTFSDWQVRTPASCTEPGEEFRACACGEEETRSIDPLGHTLVKTEAVEPTETSAGNIEYWTCTVCGKLFSDEAANNEITQAETVLPKLEHTHVYGSYAYDGNAHWQTCACGQTSERTPHAFGAWTVTKEPTYTEEGIRSRTCVCGFTETETLPCAVLLGDVNLDGKVTPTDYLLLKRQLVVEDCLTEAGKQRADINGDGALTPTDYLLLKRMILGL